MTNPFSLHSLHGGIQDVWAIANKKRQTPLNSMDALAPNGAVVHDLVNIFACLGNTVCKPIHSKVSYLQLKQRLNHWGPTRIR